jgi:hypothetical protein
LIFVKKGRYEEIVRIPSSKPYIHMIGEDKEEVVITYRINCSGQGEDGYEYSKEQLGLYDCSVVVIDAPNFYAENISFENSWGVESKKGPMALAMRNNGDRFTFNNCKFRSYQDTWQTSSKNIADRLYVHSCWIEGAVDYFYGGGNAFVDECTLYNVRPGSVIVAPSHADGTRWGYVFNSCTIDGNSSANDGNLKLGRPWKNKPIAVYLNTTMKILPHPEGWTDMGPAAKLFAEYNSMDVNGNPVDLSYRRTWYRQSAGEGGQTVTGLKALLTQEEAAEYTYENVIGGNDSWNPRAYFENIDRPQNFTVSRKAELSWDTSTYAICYIIYRDSNLIAFTAETSYADTSAAKDSTYNYWIRPVNEYGSLGSISDKVTIKVADDDPEETGSNPETSIKQEDKKGKPFAVLLGDELVIKNISPDEEVTLYNILGRVVYQKKSGSEILSIPVKGLRGFHFVKIGVGHTLKVAL